MKPLLSISFSLVLSFHHLQAVDNMYFKQLLQGKKNPGTDAQSVKSFLEQVKKAKEMEIDRYHVLCIIPFLFE